MCWPLTARERLWPFRLTTSETSSLRASTSWQSYRSSSPTVSGFYYAHIGWFLDGSHDRPNLSNVRDLARYPELRFLDRHKWLPLVAYAGGMYLIAGWPGVVWGFLVSTVACLQATMCINSLAHVWGSRRFETGDGSRNNALLALLTLGEGWHNNHHFYASAANQGFFWWEIDVSYYVLRLFAALRLVRELRTPPDRVRFAHRATVDTGPRSAALAEPGRGT